MSIHLTSKAADLFSRFSQPKSVAPAAPESVVSSSPQPSSTETSKPSNASATKEKVTARLESTQEGVCPYCSNPMRKSLVATGEVWLCEEDRHVVPLRNATGA